MTREHSIGEPAELAALYVAGALPPDECALFEAHLATGCARCQQEVRALGGVAEALLESVDAVPPSTDARERLLGELPQAEASNIQVWKRWGNDDATDPLLIRRRDEGAWQEAGVAGVRVRHLFVDRGADQVTMLVRMEAGTSYPRHIHGGAEECYVLEGELRVGDTVLHAGDYQRAAAGSQHPVQSTDAGCLLLIVSSMSDELN